MLAVAPASRTTRATLPIAVAAVLLASTALSACGGSTRSSTPAASAPLPAAQTSGPSSTTQPAAPSPAKSAPPTATPPTPSPSKPPTATRAAASPRLRAALTQFKTCMRANGVTLPEPGAKPGSHPKTTASTPQLKAAAAKCRGPLIAALKHGSSGSG